jgi:hypothetical protein
MRARREAEQKRESQDDGTHGVAPLSMPMRYVLHCGGFLSGHYCDPALSRPATRDRSVSVTGTNVSLNGVKA